MNSALTVHGFEGVRVPPRAYSFECWSSKLLLPVRPSLRHPEGGGMGASRWVSAKTATRSAGRRTTVRVVTRVLSEGVIPTLVRTMWPQANTTSMGCESSSREYGSMFPARSFWFAGSGEWFVTLVPLKTRKGGCYRVQPSKAKESSTFLVGIRSESAAVWVCHRGGL